MVVGVISPFPPGGDTYPQVAYFAEWLGKQVSVQWITISERGFRVDRLLDQTLFACAGRTFLRRSAKIAKDYRAIKTLSRNCDVLIAIDFMALVLADAASSKPVVFWSLDFISSDEARYLRKVNQKWLSVVRRALLRRSSIVIQDPDRLRAFAASLKLASDDLKPFYLPVSLPPALPEFDEAFPRQWVGKPRVMQIGGLSAWRSRTDFLLEQYRACPDQFDLYLHGSVDSDVAEQLARLNPQPQVSETMVACDRIPEIVRRCSIGYLGYSPSDEQFVLLKNASGQLVEFLRCGKPIVSVGANNLALFIEETGVGFAVKNPQEFSAAIKAIHAQYPNFSQRARVLFEKQYNFDNYSAQLLRYIKSVVNNPRQSQLGQQAC